jgi:hypothetical protein
MVLIGRFFAGPGFPLFNDEQLSVRPLINLHQEWILRISFSAENFSDKLSYHNFGQH